MCKYQNKTNKGAIEKQIKDLERPDNATIVMNMIDAICEREEIKQDRASQWFNLFHKEGVEVAKISGKHDFPLIEIYPSGRKVEDRMIFEIRDTEVEVLGAGHARHK